VLKTVVAERLAENAIQRGRQIMDGLTRLSNGTP